MGMMTPENAATAADEMWVPPGTATRRRALGVMGTAVTVGVAAAATPALGAPARTPIAEVFPTPLPPPARIPRAELVNTLQYETQARLVLGPARVAPVLGSDRTVTDRITLHPRMNISTRDLDLTCTLFGDDHFAPIIVGPMADQRRFHPDGELAMARGASAAQAGMVVSSEASLPLASIAEAATAPLWLQVYAGSPKVKDVLAQAGAAKARAVIVTVNAGASARIDWAAVEAVVRATTLPVIVKGITRPEEAREAVARGAKGVVVSNYRGGDATALPGTLLLIAPVVEAVGGQVPVLADGSFRRGTDILKALAFGAKGVLIGRPVMWGLGAYGADGVQGVVEMLQSELARYMAMSGCPTLAAIPPSLARVHAPLPIRGDQRG
jgi:4-hydroxymandelate oxidase